MANPFVRVGGFFGRFFGNTIGEAAAYGIGGALREPLHPLLQELTNATWEAGTKAGVSKPLDLSMAAEVAAELVDKYDDMKTQASFSGYDAGHFKDAYGVTLTAPGVGTLLALLRRDQTHAIDFGHGLRKNKLETDWDNALEALRNLPLDPSVIAIAIQRGVMDAPFDLPYTPPTKVGKVPAYPQSSLDAKLEASWSGETVERLRVRTALAGLPLALDQAARATFRKIITPDDYARAVLEGNTRGEWANAAFDVARQIPTARDFFENALRGYHDFAWAVNEAKRHGMSEADATVIYQNQGRPMNVRQITQALARGGTFKPEPGEITDPYDAAIVEGNLKPAYYDLAKANRYTLPSPFVMKALTTAGTWSQAKARTRLLEAGWIPEDATEAAADWATGVTSAGKELTKTELLTEFEGGYITENELRDHLAALGYSGPSLDLEVHLGDARRIRGWRDKAITALGKRYVASTMDSTAADGYLVEIGVPDPGTRANIIRIWDIEREFK